VDLQRQIAIIRTRLPLLIACVVLAGVGAFLITSQLPRVYEAKATVLVGQSLSGVNPDYNQLLASQRLSTTYAIVATTRPILDKVIKQLGLDVSTTDLRGRVVADIPQNNTLLTITARDGDATRAASIANAIVDQLIAASPAIQGHQADVQSSIDADLKATQEQISATQAQLEALTAVENRTPQQEQQLQTYEGRLVNLRSTYAALLSYSFANASNLLSVLEPAVVPTDPVAPRPLLYALLAATVALLLGAAAVFLMEYLDDTVKTTDDVRAVAGLPTLGAVTRMKRDRGRKAIYQLVTVLYPRSAAAEAYRTLRANTEFASVDAPIRTLLVTSSIAGEGKTVTAGNLAVAFAQAGRRVVLVDADLRKPGVHLLFDLPNAHGLTTLLRSDEVGIDATANTTEQANLRILTTGPLPPNPAELLGSHRMRLTLDRLTADSDLVILDGPPLQGVTDSAILSSIADGTLLVVDSGHTRRGPVRLGVDALAKAGAHVLGAVLNRIPARTRSDEAGYFGGYYDAGDGTGARQQGTETSPTG
jgi:succinoglycan biosynthesis transport protein ExoP